MAVKHSAVKDVPIKKLLGDIKDGLIKRLLDTKYGGDVSKVPTSDYLSARPNAIPSCPLITTTPSSDSTTYSFGATVPPTDIWFDTLAGSELSWRHALVKTPTVVQGTAFGDNPLRRLLVARPNQKVVVTSSSISLYGAARSWGEHNPDFKAVEITYDSSSSIINVTIFEDRTDSAVPLSLLFKYVPTQGFAPIHEVIEGRNNRIKSFYWQLWFGDNSELPELKVDEAFEGPEVTINAADIEQFCAVVGNQSEAFKAVHTDKITAPMDFGIVAGWQVWPFVCFTK